MQHYFYAKYRCAPGEGVRGHLVIYDVHRRNIRPHHLRLHPKLPPHSTRRLQYASDPSTKTTNKALDSLLKTLQIKHHIINTTHAKGNTQDLFLYELSNIHCQPRYSWTRLITSLSSSPTHIPLSEGLQQKEKGTFYPFKFTHLCQEEKLIYPGASSP